ncbi:MAG: hypothetical protein ABIH23_35550 [bacterium]
MDCTRFQVRILPGLAVLFLPVLFCISGCRTSPDAAVSGLMDEEEAQLKFRELVDIDKFTWLREATRNELTGCLIQGHDGTQLPTPDGVGNYRALWVRDFSFMVEYAGDLMDAMLVHQAIRYLLRGQREDGCMPDRVRADGVPIYSPGGDANPINDHAKDNGPFMVKLVAMDVERRDDLAFFREVEPALQRGLDFLVCSSNGLVWNDPADPQSPFGFTDTIAKTGDLLFTSVLYWEACKSMEDLARRSGVGDADDYAQRAKRIRAGLATLWDEETGMFFAASRDCHQIDIWGSAYAVSVGIATAQQTERIASYLDSHCERIVQCGQVRHLPGQDLWNRMLIPIKPGTYQNGAYWGTASGWVIHALYRKIGISASLP